MRRFFLVRNRLEQRYLRLIALSLVLPALITGTCLYYVIFNLMAEQLGIPEVIAYHLLPVVERANVILMVSLPIVFLVLFAIGFVLSRNLAGPIERLERELKKITHGDLRGKRLRLRKKDVLRPLVDEINVLLEKIEKKN